MNWKECGRKELWYNPGICLEELRESKNNFNQDGRFLAQDLNLEPSKYRAGVLPI
ncbi:hypothetical protein B7P43_G01135 [Cryptotermes secundus]|uniref:Uncharacterized protein n=1 Tax=Cryptotermes secundus TaxID=105785 RepID=A0A2J7QZT5_9NEOP|nr:hypothetical protein B7P43_G01135 [Cryptotermes secundus]